MNTYNAKLIKKEAVAEGTMAFHFEKPAGFEFKAGQYLDLTLINPPLIDDEGSVRPLSIASAPGEPDLMVATRIRGTAFKKSLSQMELGTEARLDGPMGAFTLHQKSERPGVFLIGGIGITPIRSILVDAARNHWPHKLFLFYSNRRPADSAFLDELKNLEKENPNFKLIAAMTAELDTWEGESGYITEEMIIKYIPEIIGPIYYLAGPQAMVAAMRKLLNNAGISDDDIKAEEFSGY